MAVETLKKCFAADANRTYFNLAPQDPDLVGLHDDARFQELFAAATAPSLPQYNPRLGDAPR